MHIEESISAIEACESYDELRTTLQTIIENYGFAAFNFMDTGHPHLDMPFTDGTSGKAWEADYQGNRFVHSDLWVASARRSNMPFSWGSLALPPQLGVRKPGAVKLMEAAADHRWSEGLVIPFHFTDEIGRLYSCLVVLFWKDRLQRFMTTFKLKRHELHVVMIYWMQRAVELKRADFRPRSSTFGGSAVRAATEPAPLSDKEREVVAWAARGKTTSGTADIMGVSEATAETHMRNAMRKLGAENRTHAVAIAIYRGLIDI
ncbi:LuxR C-terminal-related transcriptional regulator [Ancylobacter sp. SL191]|uniref:LuxR C-terminal-related transcriptional regulator n=1 Tax=Ancylobacter sp. SL191 TaxID=2995166 RepID=UPI00226F4851|nr:LuxR C-terminal-related transcriptional regulator [Ancylobacter sp. SL191]WAC27854.1 LuxR C-terminal-related transcriptional regulator [Ancylobacter sp. SL191]